MSIEPFLSAIDQLRTAVKRDALKFGLPADEAESLAASYSWRWRKEALALPQLEDGPLRELLERVDIGGLTLGPLEFHSAPRAHKHGLEISTEEADAVVVMESDHGDVAVFDHANTDYVIYRLAEEQAAFYLAMLRCMEVQADRNAWSGRGNAAVEYCSAAAGGAQYRTFYEGLLGEL